MDVTRDDNVWLGERFEVHRDHLRAVAYRMLGSLDEADDAVQEAWLRLDRSDIHGIENLRGWLTVVVARVCLDMLRSRKARRENPLETDVHGPILSHRDEINPEQEALLADSVGLALLVVLDTLDPAERLAFVLHDMFAVPFDEISSIVGRSPVAARQLASRARRRLQGEAAIPDPDLARQREVVDAFVAASRGGDFDALLRVLDPEVVVRADHAAARADTPQEVRGATAVAKQALSYARLARFAHPALVNQAVGIIVAPNGHLFAVMVFKFKYDKIIAIDMLADRTRLSQLDLAVLDE
jgi:RNA polymerase sigma factor (sigma-70 family)